MVISVRGGRSASRELLRSASARPSATTHTPTVGNLRVNRTSKEASSWMAKVHPNAAVIEVPATATPPEAAGEAAVLTVWRKSLLLNFSGFTVFDAKGNLVFRVDNYVSGTNREVVLMDAAGKPLLTIRRKRLSLGDHWLVYQGEEAAHPRFSAKKHITLLQSKSLAHVVPCAASGVAAAKPHRVLEIEGSYARRCCAVYDERRRRMAEIKRKEAVGGVGFGGDVFRLVVQPGFDAPVAMAIVILLDQMFRSRGSLAEIFA